MNLNDIQVKSELPIPEPRRNYASKWKDFFENRCPPNHHFTVDTNAERCAAMSAARHLGIKVRTRKIPGVGIEVWRVE